MAEDQLPAELPTEPPKYADITLTPEQEREAYEQYPEDSPAKALHRKRLSILATLRHQYVDPSTGRHAFGGAQPNAGRKPTKRIGEALVEAAQGRHKEVVDAAFSALQPGNDAMVRHRAAMNIARHEREERAMDMAEDEFARKTEDEVRGDATKLLAKMVREGRLSVEDILSSSKVDAEADAEEIDDAQIAS